MIVEDLIKELETLPKDLDVILARETILNKTASDSQNPLYAHCKQGRACYWKDGILETRDCVLIVTK